MDYLNETLGIKTVYRSLSWKDVPHFIEERYRLKGAFVDGVKVTFVYPKGALENVEAVKKHLERIGEGSNAHAVLVLESLAARERGYLISNRIPFIVTGKQIYLPFMALSLQERGFAEGTEKEEISPAAQLLLLHFIYCGGEELCAKDACQKLKLSKISFSRAGRELADKGLLQSRKEGRMSVLFSDLSPKALFEKDRGSLLNPIKRVIYVDKSLLDEGLLRSGYSALSSCSMLNDDGVSCFAAPSISKWEGASTRRLCDSKKQARVEYWRYDPKRLSAGEEVDPLSLALSLQSDPDERVEQALEEMLDRLWRKMDGKRD